MRPSPQPTASRLFTVLLTVVLISSLAAPFAAGPAVADEDDDGGGYVFYCSPQQVGITDPLCDVGSPTEISPDGTIIHSTATAEGEGMDSHHVMLDNHFEDTNTIASIEARHAVAQSWEDGESASQAYQNAMEAIRDYYAIHQENHLERKSKMVLQMSNAVDAAEQDEDTPDDFVTHIPLDTSNSGANSISASLTNNQTTTHAELVNGETHEFQTAWVHFQTTPVDSTAEYKYHYNLVHPDYDHNADRVRIDSDVENDSIQLRSRNQDGGYTGDMVIPNIGDVDDGGLPSETVFSHEEWYTRWEEIEQQSDQAVANYDVEFVEALYAELDAGNLDPEDVRGAEGMARHLSGDSEVTSQRFQLALMQMHGMSNPDLAGASSMTVEYEGYTDIVYNGTDSDERVPELSGHTDDTFEGLLFASEVPDGGFETNQTYAVGDVNTNGTDLEPVDGSVQVFDVTEGETTHFYEGTFTVTEMYDADGNQVETVEWEQPKYDTYNASEFAAYIEEVQDLRDEIAELTDDDDGLSIGLPDWDLDDVETGEALVGLVIIVVVAMAIIGLVTDLLPWF